MEVTMSVSKRTWKNRSGARMKWVVRYRDADGKQRLRTFKRESDAKDWEAQLRGDLKKGVHRPDSTSAVLRDAVGSWLARAEAEKLEPTTITNYEIMCRRHIEPATVPDGTLNGWKGELGDIKLTRITTPQCVVFQRHLLSNNARRRAQAIFTAFGGILGEAVKQGLIAHNPASDVRFKSSERDLVPIQIGEHIPAKEEMRVILKATTGLWHPLCFAATFSGMRASELRGLTWPNVDLDGGFIRVRQRADFDGRIGFCKSKSGYRTIPIPTPLVDVLREWKTRCPASDLDLVFPTKTGEVIRHSGITRAWWRIQRELGIVKPDGRPKYVFHSMRHFFASLMIEQATPPKRLQEIMGHANIGMTMDVYGHLFPAGAEEHRRIDQAVESVFAANDNDPPVDKKSPKYDTA
jgi:integrase